MYRRISTDRTPGAALLGGNTGEAALDIGKKGAESPEDTWLASEDLRSVLIIIISVPLPKLIGLSPAGCCSYTGAH